MQEHQFSIHSKCSTVLFGTGVGDALKSIFLVLLCPITCPLGYCFRREAPKPKPREEVKWIPPPPPQVIYEKPPPPRIEYVPAPPSNNLCPVFVPNDFRSLPNEGIQRLDILPNPEIPLGFQDLRFTDLPTGKPVNGHALAPGNVISSVYAPVPINQQGFQGSTVISDVAIGGWMPTGISR